MERRPVETRDLAEAVEEGRVPAALASRLLSSKRRSPPRIAWPCVAIASVIGCDTELTAAIGAGAERDAGEEDVEAGEAAAQFAQRKAEGNAHACGDAAAHAADRLGCRRHSARCRLRSRRSARGSGARSGRQGGSWVTSSSVMPRSRLLGKQQVGDLPAGLGVEIAGRLVGDQDGGRGRQRAGDRDALLLAARSWPG